MTGPSSVMDLPKKRDFGGVDLLDGFLECRDVDVVQVAPPGVGQPPAFPFRQPLWNGAQYGAATGVSAQTPLEN